MKKIVMSLVILASATSASAMQVGGVAVATASFAISAATFATFARSNANHKLIVAAQDDAAMFVATQGQVRGVQLQEALQALRSENPAMSSSDLEIAQGILNY
jgi:uncharacterized protein (TIGR02448 family)